MSTSSASLRRQGSGTSGRSGPSTPQSGLPSTPRRRLNEHLEDAFTFCPNGREFEDLQESGSLAPGVGGADAVDVLVLGDSGAGTLDSEWHARKIETLS